MVELDADGGVTSSSMLALETMDMLARRFGRTKAEIFALIARDGWSNGQIVGAAE